MTNSQWQSMIMSESFWGGVIASIIAAAIVGIFLSIFKNSTRIFIERRKKGKREDEIFAAALRGSGEVAPFAFGVVQGRALRYFLTAVFIAYVGDSLSMFSPINNLIYVFSLYYLYLALRLFYKIEGRALELMDKNRASI